MSHIVLAIGTSHSPMLNASVHEWARFEQREPSTRLLDRSGRPSSYAALLEEAAGRFDAEVGPEPFARRHAAAQQALNRLGQEIEDARLDAIVLFGDDQKELFLDDNLPGLMVYKGPTFPHTMRPAKKDWVDWFADVQSRYYPRTGRFEHPVQVALADHLIDSLMGQDFDLSVSLQLPRGEGQGHAFAFLYQRLLGWCPPDFLVPPPPRRPAVPIVPVFINTYFAPNQPSPQRCHALGVAVRQAVEAFPGGLRVGVLASGGLTHFAVDADFDGRIVDALRSERREGLANLPTALLNSGNSEIRNWIAMAGASGHLAPGWTEYIPGYRTRAGTGTGFCFSVLRNDEPGART